MKGTETWSGRIRDRKLNWMIFQAIDSGICKPTGIHPGDLSDNVMMWSRFLRWLKEGYAYHASTAESARATTRISTTWRTEGLPSLLFTRFVIGGFPYVVFEEQHRMCPELTALVSDVFYHDELVNHPSVLVRHPTTAAVTAVPCPVAIAESRIYCGVWEWLVTIIWQLEKPRDCRA